MIAYHWLKKDMRAGSGRERAWKIGERRVHKAQTLIICERGYHSSPTPSIRNRISTSAVSVS